MADDDKCNRLFGRTKTQRRDSLAPTNSLLISAQNLSEEKPEGHRASCMLNTTCPPVTHVLSLCQTNPHLLQPSMQSCREKKTEDSIFSSACLWQELCDQHTVFVISASLTSSGSNNYRHKHPRKQYSHLQWVVQFQNNRKKSITRNRHGQYTCWQQLLHSSLTCAMCNSWGAAEKSDKRLKHSCCQRFQRNENSVRPCPNKAYWKQAGRHNKKQHTRVLFQNSKQTTWFVLTIKERPKTLMVDELDPLELRSMMYSTNLLISNFSGLFLASLKSFHSEKVKNQQEFHHDFWVRCLIEAMLRKIRPKKGQSFEIWSINFNRRFGPQILLSSPSKVDLQFSDIIPSRKKSNCCKLPRGYRTMLDWSDVMLNWSYVVGSTQSWANQSRLNGIRNMLIKLRATGKLSNTFFKLNDRNHHGNWPEELAFCATALPDCRMATANTHRMERSAMLLIRHGAFYQRATYQYIS